MRIIHAVMNALILCFRREIELTEVVKYVGDVIPTSPCEAYANFGYQNPESDYEIPYRHLQNMLPTIPPAKGDGDSADHLYNFIPGDTQ